MAITIYLYLLFVPCLSLQQCGGRFDYGIWATLQFPFILAITAAAFLLAWKWRASLGARGLIAALAYVCCTATTNLLGEKYLQVDHSQDLPIRKRLSEYGHPYWPTRAEVVTDLGPPLTSAVLSVTNKNLPGNLMASVRYAPPGCEVLAYEETDRKGRRFTYFIFIEPRTGRKGFHHELVGALSDDLWPRQPPR